LWLGFVAISAFLIIIALVGYHRVRIRNLEQLYKLNKDVLKRRDAQRAPSKEDVSSGFAVEDAQPVDEQYDVLKAQRLRVVFGRVESAMNDQGLYRKSGLTLPELSDSLGVSKRLLSEAINLCAEVSFPEYLSTRSWMRPVSVAGRLSMLPLRKHQE